jgi:hypothetical protein
MRSRSQKYLETLWALAALSVVMDLSKSIGVKVMTRGNRRERLWPRPLLQTMVLPQTQAGLAPWSGTRLFPIPKGEWIQMNPDRFDPMHAPNDDAASFGRMDDEAPNDEAAEDHAAHSRIGLGARAMNRLLWSFWFMLLPFLWPSSDWIGLVILSQALLVATKLVRPSNSKTISAASLSDAVLTMDEGEDSARG